MSRDQWRNDVYAQLAASPAEDVNPIAAALLETLDDHRFRNLRDQALDELHLIPGSVVLDAGCGPGLLLEPLHDRVTSEGSIHGLDLNPHFISVAERRADMLKLDNTTFTVDDCHELPYRDEMFDAVVAEKLLMHVAPLSRVIQEVRRVLAPGGRAVFIDYDPYTIMVAGPDPNITFRVMASAARVYASPTAARETALVASKADLYVEQVRGYLQVFEDPKARTVEGVPEIWSDHATGGHLVEPGTARRWLKAVERAAQDGRFMISIPYIYTVVIRDD